MMFISFAVRSTDPHNHGSKTTICWFWWTCNESKQHYITGYIMTLCNLQIHWYTLFSFLVFSCSTACLFIAYENPPNKCAKLTRQINPPKCLAMETCQIHLRVWPANFTCQRSPLPRSKSPGRTWLANLLPPPQLRQRSRRGGGGGARSRPGPPMHLEQVLLLFSWMITYSCKT